MEELNATTVFWLFAMGLMVGMITKLVMGNRGLKLVSNVISGALGTALIGAITIGIGIPGSMIFAFMGSLALLFIMNIFNIEHKHPAETNVIRKK